MLQGAPIIRKAHGGDAFQDLVQLLLARGLKAKWTPGVRRSSPRNTSTRQGLTDSLNTKTASRAASEAAKPTVPSYPARKSHAVDV